MSKIQIINCGKKEEKKPTKQKKSNVHAGHRQRLRQRFLDNGFENMPTHESLEMILTYCIPLRDTNPIAHNLIDTFGSISSVLDAPLDELIKIDGITETSATFLKMLPQLTSLYMSDIQSMDTIVDSSQKAADFLLPRYIGATSEKIYIMLLSALGKILYCGNIAKGQKQNVTFDISKIVEISSKYHATSLVLSHNHPSGVALPSKSDIVATKNLKKALDLMHIHLFDHIIFANNDWVSFLDSQMMEHLDEL